MPLAGPGIDFIDCGLNGGNITDLNKAEGEARSASCED
jgi:hypothetical protein